MTSSAAAKIYCISAEVVRENIHDAAVSVVLVGNCMPQKNDSFGKPVPTRIIHVYFAQALVPFVVPLN